MKPSTPSLPSEGVQESSVVGSEEFPQDLDYSTMTLSELKKIAKEKGIEGYSSLKKAELIKKLG